MQFMMFWSLDYYDHQRDRRRRKSIVFCFAAALPGAFAAQQPAFYAHFRIFIIFHFHIF